MPAPITTFVDVTVIPVGAAIPSTFDFGATLGVFEHTVNTDRQNGPYFNLQEVVDAGFTSVAEPEVYGWATAFFSQNPRGGSVIVGLKAVGDADYTAAMTGIAAEDPTTWYWTNIQSRVQADIEDVAAWTEANSSENPHMFIAQDDDLTGVAATALNAAGYHRTALIYHAADGEWLDGAWTGRISGINMDAANGMGVTMYKQLAGVPFDEVTGAQATLLYGVGANIYGRNKGLSFTSQGTAASLRFLDVTMTQDWVKARSEEAIIAAFVNSPTKIPYDNAGINTMASVCQGVLNTGVINGHFRGPENSVSGQGPRIIAPLVSEVDQADRAARILRLTGEAELSGAIQQVTYVLNVQI